MNRTHRHNFIFLLLFFYQSLFGNETGQIVDAFRQTINDINDVIKQTNADEPYRPYIISIYQGEELKSVGVSTLEQAIRVIVGGDLYSNRRNESNFVFRGSYPFAHGQTRLEIDGIDVNQLLNEDFGQYMRLPIELIKRIEVVRGPEATVTTENAFTGKVRVITYAENHSLILDGSHTTVFGAVGSENLTGAGMRYTYKKDDLFIHADFYVKRDKAFGNAGYDAANTGAFSYPDAGIDNYALSSNANVDLGRQDLGASLKLEYKGYYLMLRQQNTLMDAAYGNVNLVPRNIEDNYTKKQASYAEVGFKKRAGDFRIGLQAGYKRAWEKNHELTAPPGIVYFGLNTFPNPVVFDEGIFIRFDSVIETYYGKGYLTYDGFKNHSFEIQVKSKHDKVAEQSFVSTNRDTGSGLMDMMPYTPILIPGSNRTTYLASAGDIYRFSRALTLSGVINFEYNTQYQKTIVEPKASLVYRATPKDTVKMIYAKSHRSPSFRELYRRVPEATMGNSELRPPKVDSMEVGYTRDVSDNSYFQVNAYFLRTSDRIEGGAVEDLYVGNTPVTSQLQNIHDTDVWGFSLEGKFSPWENGTVYANYSFTDGKYADGSPLTLVAKDLISAYYLHDFGQGFSGALRGNYIGEKDLLDNDYRTHPVEDAVVVNAALTFHTINNTIFQIALLNVTDEDYRIPTLPYTYDDNYVQPGRTLYFSMEKSF